SSLKGLHRVGLLAYGYGDLVQGQPPQDAKQQHVTLVRREAGEDSTDATRAQSPEGLLLRLADQARAPQDLRGHGLDRPAAPVAVIVHQAMARDGERPRAESALPALETPDPAHDMEEHVAQHVVRVRCPRRPEVGADLRGHVPVELGPGPLGPDSGRAEDRFEML